MAIPTLNVVKCQLETVLSRCEKSKSETPGCQKRNCVLTSNCCFGLFIAEEIQNVLLNQEFEFDNKSNLSYEKIFLPNYTNTIWHPPKNCLPA